jgi:hypothetical protein
MEKSRQVKRAEERNKKKAETRMIKRYELSDFKYVADDRNMTLSAMSSQLIDFIKVVDIRAFLKELVQIDKRQSTYSPDMLSQLFILQNILGYGRVEGSKSLDQDAVMKDKLGIDRYPDPETFRDELKKYTEKNIEGLFLVNQKVIDIICRLGGSRSVDLHIDAKVITVFGDQENAEVGYNPRYHGRKSYHLKVCTIEPFGFILAIQLEPGTSVSSTDFMGFYKKCLEAVPQNRLTVHTVRLDSGFFSGDHIESFEGDTIFYEMVAKKYPNLDQWIKTCIPDEDFTPFFPDETVFGAPLTFPVNGILLQFVVVKRLLHQEIQGQEALFPAWRFQVICHNQEDMTPKEVWEDYSKRARIELNIRDLDYDHFITNVPTGNFFSNYAYMWHCVLAYNLMLIFKNYLLPEDWSTCRTPTLRKKLINMPGRLVNRAGVMVMRLMAGFPFVEVLSHVKERLLWMCGVLKEAPA